MSKAPGPWRRDMYGAVVDANGRDVRFRSVSICCSGDGVKEAEENTDLIAAAPDLLAALTAITEMAERCDSWESFPSGPIAVAYDAIAKATGEK